MKRYLFKIFSPIFFVFAFSCASTKYILIDVTQPAKVTFPANIVNVALVDNAGLVIPDSIADESHTKEDKDISAAKETFKNHLVKQMNEQEFFNEVSLYPYLLRTDKRYGQQVPLMESEIREIAKEMNVDAVISLDIFYMSQAQSKGYFFGKTFTTNVIKESILFKLYDANGNMIAPAMATSDSVNYIMEEEVANYDTYVYNQLSKIMAEGVVTQLIPYWETQERVYYTDGTKEMKQAHKEVEQGNWIEAADFWGQAFDKVENNKQKAKIASNIALANEHLGDLNNAVTWINLASDLIGKSEQNSEEKTYIMWYQGQLQRREKASPKVLQQLGVSEVKEEIDPESTEE